MKNKIDLKGKWAFALDGYNVGISQKWFKNRLEDSIRLPGTTDEAKKGEFADECCTDRLSRIWRWVGPAWYQKEVEIPKTWKDKRISLYLERTKDSQVWIDNKWAGNDDSLSTPHEYDLSKFLTPGKHTITILIDNAKLPPVGPCHQVDERTQTNWNGIVGRIELIATDKLWIDDLQAFPDTENGTVKVKDIIVRNIKCNSEASVSINAEVAGKSKSVKIPSRRIPVKIKGVKTPFECEIKFPDEVPQWDEFENRMIDLTATVNGKAGSKKLRTSQTVRFGYRNFTTSQGQFVINGRKTFLRGKNDCALFPITGYAPMYKNEWKRLLKISADYGMNHYRFHTWCPPEAAFQAADELGIYFQIELPNKREITTPDNKDYKPPKEAYETLAELEGDGGPPAIRTAYLYREGERMLKHFGNHPSFVMMTLGNELGGDEEVMRGMCEHFRAIDDRHLYAMGTGHFHWDIGYREGDEFWVTRGTTQDHKDAVRGASFEAELHIESKPPSTTVDYRDALNGVQVPVVAHEMAQQEVFPDFDEAEKYTGVVKGKCFDIFKERLEKAGMLDQAKDFAKASGKISAICHREDTEAAIRTPGFGGFQMLDLQDFSGQGVALIGMLDVFMDSKGIISGKEWSQFCCETVPLLWMTKYTWTTDETFLGRIRVAHYGPKDLDQQKLKWQITEGKKKIAEGDTRPVDIPTGTVTEIDLFSASLSKVNAPAKLTVVIEIPKTKYRNTYDIWVYPAKNDNVVSKKVRIARTFTKEVKKSLEKGGTVLLIPKPEITENSVRMMFPSSFWSPMFRNRPGKLNPLGKECPGTQGILCDPKHPVFKEFPTEFHTNWQWWQLVTNSRAMILDNLPVGEKPIVQVVDGFDRNHKLGLLFEVKVGKGKLLICTMDLPELQEHPEARQLLKSIYDYAESKAFNPKLELTDKEIRKLLK